MSIVNLPRLDSEMFRLIRDPYWEWSQQSRMSNCNGNLVTEQLGDDRTSFITLIMAKKGMSRVVGAEYIY